MSRNSMLIAARELHGWSPLHVTQWLETPTHLYEQWEAGLAEPSLPRLRRLCALFSQPPEALGFVIYPTDALMEGPPAGWHRQRNGHLYLLRCERHLTQKELAEHLNVTMTTFCNWEHGRACPSRRHLAALCAFFGCSPVELGYPDHVGWTQLLQPQQASCP